MAKSVIYELNAENVNSDEYYENILAKAIYETPSVRNIIKKANPCTKTYIEESYNWMRVASEEEIKTQQLRTLRRDDKHFDFSSHKFSHSNSIVDLSESEAKVALKLGLALDGVLPTGAQQGFEGYYGDWDAMPYSHLRQIFNADDMEGVVAYRLSPAYEPNDKRLNIIIDASLDNEPSIQNITSALKYYTLNGSKMERFGMGDVIKEASASIGPLEEFDLDTKFVIYNVHDEHGREYAEKVCFDFSTKYDDGSLCIQLLNEDGSICDFVTSQRNLDDKFWKNHDTKDCIVLWDYNHGDDDLEKFLTYNDFGEIVGKTSLNQSIMHLNLENIMSYTVYGCDVVSRGFDLSVRHKSVPSDFENIGEKSDEESDDLER